MFACASASGDPRVPRLSVVIGGVVQGAGRLGKAGRRATGIALGGAGGYSGAMNPLILGIESSCDETAVALVRGDRTIVAQAIASQDAAHRPFGGVVPELAARAHVEVLTPMIARVLADGGVTLADVDAVAATAGPGLIGGVMVGLVTAKALAFAAAKPLLAVNHLEGHALSPRLADAGLAFPYLLLLVSGGHCQLLAVDGVGRYRRLATTIDDAVGEAFDKVAKLLALGFPGGPAVERAAATGDRLRFRLPRPLVGSDDPQFLVRRAEVGGDARPRRRWQASAPPTPPTSPPGFRRPRSTA